jgi:ribokinase
LIGRRGEGGAALSDAAVDELPDLARHGLASGGFEMTLARFFRNIHELGPRWVVITDGRDGAYVGAPSGILHCPAVPVTAAGTAGAGDAFNSTFAAYITQSASAEDAVLAASANAASVISYIDTQTGLLRRRDIEARVTELKSTLKVRHWKA